MVTTASLRPTRGSKRRLKVTTSMIQIDSNARHLWKAAACLSTFNLKTTDREASTMAPSMESLISGIPRNSTIERTRAAIRVQQSFLMASAGQSRKI